MPLARSVLRKVARWAIPKLESFARLGKPIISLTYLRREPPKVPDLLQYRLDINSPDVADAARHEASYSVDGGELIKVSAVSGRVYEFPENSHVRFWVVAFDSADNASEPSDILEFTAVEPDVTPPGKPVISLSFVGRRPAEEPVPA